MSPIEHVVSPVKQAAQDGPLDRAVTAMLARLRCDEPEVGDARTPAGAQSPARPMQRYSAKVRAHALARLVTTT